MKVTFKVWLLTTVATVLICIIGNVGFALFFNDYLDEQEFSSLRLNIRNIAHEIKEEKENLQSKADDWAVWDDTYFFLQGKNGDYVQNNLNTQSLINLKVNTIIYYQNSGQVFHKVFFDQEKNRITAFPKSLLQIIDKVSFLQSKNNQVIVAYEGKFILLAKRNVSNSTGDAPSNGVIIIGKSIDRSKFNELNSLSNAKTQLKTQSTAGFKRNFDIEGTPFAYIISQDEQQVTAQAMLQSEKQGQKIYLVLDKERSIYIAGLQSTFFLHALVTFFVTAVFYLLWMFLNRFVNKPFQKLMTEIIKTQIDTPEIKLLSKEKNKEFSKVVDSINTLLSRFESQKFRLEESQKQFQEAFNHSPIGMALVSLDGRWLQVNESICTMFGYTADELSSKTFQELTYPDDLQSDMNNVQNLLDGKINSYCMEKRYFTKEGKIFWGRLSVGLVRDHDNQPVHFVSQIEEITARKEQQDLMRFYSYHDSLTGVFNRRSFDEKMAEIGKKAKEMTLIIGDLDGLKFVNDAFGHSAGDAMLQKVADILKQQVGDTGDVYRVGGDEFVILLYHCQNQQAVNIIERIQKACQDDSQPDAPLTISFGMANTLMENQSVKECYKKAEDRMYTSKMLEGKSAKSKVFDNFRLVLAERTGETEAHCQRMAEMALALGKKIKLSNYEIEQLQLLAYLHDIGKTGVPDHILNKPSLLTDEEMESMKKHSEIGYRIASAMPELVPIADGILHHHERWDGTGYPVGLKQNQIPTLARIITILDSYDAMTHDRPYRSALSKDEAIREIVRCSGTQFDPVLVQVFVGFLQSYQQYTSGES